MRILMIEDDNYVSAVVRHTVETVLEDEDASVEVVSCLSEADVGLSERVYDLIVLDVSLPDGNGLQWLRYQPVITRQRIPVIVLSASIGVDNITDAIEFGATHFLNKSLKTISALPDYIADCFDARQAALGKPAALATDLTIQSPERKLHVS